ncbi:MAG: hypothetical protein JST84_04210 [Acidobacteria bacterium]|nr:hypothetical protein [Acidobacteriota bacterium]
MQLQLPVLSDCQRASDTGCYHGVELTDANLPGVRVSRIAAYLGYKFHKELPCANISNLTGFSQCIEFDLTDLNKSSLK